MVIVLCYLHGRTHEEAARDRASRLANGREPPCAGHQALEADRVDVVIGHRQAVTHARCFNSVGTERPTQPHHGALHHLRPGFGRGLAPQRVGQTIRRQHLTRLERERGQDHAVAMAQAHVTTGNEYGAEHADLHAGSVEAGTRPVKGRDTGVIPARRRRDTAYLQGGDISSH